MRLGLYMGCPAIEGPLFLKSTTTCWGITGAYLFLETPLKKERS